MEQLSLFDIQYPIYGISSKYKKIWNEFNVLYIKTESGTYILDNKNVPGNTLGIRRLNIKNNETSLYIPRKICHNLEQLLHSKYKHFIDNSGTCFTYKKTETVPLKYHKVEKVVELKDGTCMIVLHSIDFPQKVNCRRAYATSYVGVLYTKYGYLLYSFEEEYKNNTTRKI